MASKTYAIELDERYVSANNKLAIPVETSGGGYGYITWGDLEPLDKKYIDAKFKGYRDAVFEEGNKAAHDEMISAIKKIEQGFEQEYKQLTCREIMLIVRIKKAMGYEADEIKVGDVCEYKHNPGIPFVVTQIKEECFCAIYEDGITIEDGTLELIQKTGKHINALKYINALTSVLEGIK